MNSCFPAGRESGDKNKGKESAQNKSRKIKKKMNSGVVISCLLASSLTVESGESGWKMVNGK